MNTAVSVNDKRRHIQRQVKRGKRVGYGALLIAIVAVVYGALTNFNTITGIVMTMGLIISIGTLPLSMVIGYGLRAAEREERNLK